MDRSSTAVSVGFEQALLENSVRSSSQQAALDPAMLAIKVGGKFFSRGGRRFRVSGVTYGPFPADSDGEPFPTNDRIDEDLALMQAAGINAIRTYHLPPPRLLEAAAEHGIAILIDVPWSKHLCFLDSTRAQAEARRAVRSAVEAAQGHSAAFAYSIANEIPANIVRWHGVARIERFLKELHDVAKQADPHVLTTYANFPPTEFLDLSFLDFVTFNVYLHDRDVFRRYLQRLQNLVGEKPLLLGELGMDTFRHGELGQASFLEGHLREAVLEGLAGAFVFSWTDDWHTGGYQIEDWAFGITDAARQPKAAYHAVREVFESTPVTLLPSVPRVSVVVCSYNGAPTLEQCLQSLLKVDYPNYEVIVVDDGSTDHTADILAQYSTVRSTRQENRGLSAARNVGLREATGSIVAYTDSDCFVDRDWLALLVAQLEKTGAAAVGGPNLAPDDGWLAGCVAASPGQPMHVLESDQVAEHIPGCNMAFRKEALSAINGFDYEYRKAGDDVDVCWRLQHAGYWITFAPGAFVWHHRRQTPLAYLRQQAGYGEAEALVRFKHPDHFNVRGDGKWNGVLYGASLQGLCLERPIIYSGTFGTGFFQCLYQPQTSHWAMFPSTLEWHLAIALCCLLTPLWVPAAGVAVAMWLVSLLVAGLQAAQAKLQPQHERPLSRVVIMLLCYAQPLVRGWSRQRTRLFSYRRPGRNLPAAEDQPSRMPIYRPHFDSFWSQDGLERTHLLGLVIAYLNERRWSHTLDTGWKSWDFEVFCHPWTVIRVATAQEEHGSNKRLIRVRYNIRPSGYTRTARAVALVLASVAIAFWSWPYGVVAGLLLCATSAAFWHGSYRSVAAKSLVDSVALELGLLRCRHDETASAARASATGVGERSKLPVEVGLS